MSAIRTPKHNTKKQIVVNLASGQTVNVARRWGVWVADMNLFCRSYYYKRSAEEAAKMLNITTSEGFFEVDEIDFSRIIDSEGAAHNNWRFAENPELPNETRKEWNKLLAQL